MVLKDMRRARVETAMCEHLPLDVCRLDFRKVWEFPWAEFRSKRAIRGLSLFRFNETQCNDSYFSAMVMVGTVRWETWNRLRLLRIHLHQVID